MTIQHTASYSSFSAFSVQKEMKGNETLSIPLWKSGVWRANISVAETETDGDTFVVLQKHSGVIARNSLKVKEPSGQYINICRV